MTVLQFLNGFGKRALVALLLTGLVAISVSAQKVASQQEGKRYGDPGFRGEAINLNVVNADVRDILNYITQEYGINFVIDKSVKSVPVTVNVNDVPWNIALDSVLQSQDLGVQVNGPILRVAERKVLGDESATAAKIRESQLDSSPLYTEFIRLNYSRATGSLSSQAGSAGGFTGGAEVGSSSSAGGAGGSDKGILGIIQRRLSRRGAIEVDARSNTLIVTDVRENIDAVRQLIKLLDAPEPQVEIEARIVIASRTFSRDLGVQLAALVLGPRGSGASGATVPGSVPATTGGGGGGSGANTTGTRPGGIPVGIGLEPNRGLTSSIPNTVIGLTTGIFGTAQISALITAGENKGQVKTIATPRVTTLNNRSATIESGSQIPVTTVQPGAAAGGAVVVTTTYISVPLRLAVTPQITDVGTVVLNVVAENNTAAPSAGGPPPISMQRMQTEVMVPDGGTTVVGGALFDDEREDISRTPGLSKIPGLGNLFKRKGVSRNTNEILFFITPRIHRMDFEGNLISGKVSEDARTTTLLQPVPLGNPPSNSGTQTSVQPTQPVIVAPFGQQEAPASSAPTKP